MYSLEFSNISVTTVISVTEAVTARFHGLFTKRSYSHESTYHCTAVVSDMSAIQYNVLRKAISGSSIIRFESCDEGGIIIHGIYSWIPA